MPDQEWHEIIKEFERPNVHEQVGAMAETIRKLRVENRKIEDEGQELKKEIKYLEQGLAYYAKI